MGRYGKFTYVCTYRIVIGWNMRRIGREGVSYVSIDGGVKSLQFPAPGTCMSFQRLVLYPIL